MVQTITIKVGVCCEKRRRKALQLAAAAQGVVSAELMNGEDQVIVTGDEVDAVCLTISLRKKFGCAKLLSLKDVDPDGSGKGGGGGGGGGGDGDKEESSPGCPCGCNCNCCHQFPPPPPPACPIAYFLLDADPYPKTICSIM